MVQTRRCLTYEMLNLKIDRLIQSVSQLVTCYIVHTVAMVLRSAMISRDHEVHESIPASTYLFSRLADDRIRFSACVIRKRIEWRANISN